MIFLKFCLVACRLFERNAELLTLFEKFRELKTPAEQAESLELAEHATVVMNSIDEGIMSMDNVDFFFDLLHQIGGSHLRIPGFKKEYFWVRSTKIHSIKYSYINWLIAWINTLLKSEHENKNKLRNLVVHQKFSIKSFSLFSCFYNAI